MVENGSQIQTVRQRLLELSGSGAGFVENSVRVRFGSLFGSLIRFSEFRFSEFGSLNF